MHAAMCAAGPAAAQAAYTACAISATRVYSTDRLPQRPSVRVVSTPQGDRSVTILDGYRVLYYVPPNNPLLNVKAEMLADSTYGTDKLALTDNLLLLASQDHAIQKVEPYRSGSINVFMVSRSNLEGGTLAIAELFDDSRHRVTTIYFLNDEPARRHFQTMTEFASLRDRVITEFTQCLAQQHEQR